ncbi:PMT family glycosyltransferase protein [Rhizobium phaseoli]|uniref:Glycosyltransferase family 39 protein n=2 Tax=Rhizobium TaxID=379 RepID=A0A7X6J1S4_9HYPH|nr:MULTISPECIES: glycosyltransferase family 39 protein [Rhizobium]ACE90398.1 putative glycosyltransferase protein [Rhizobium etli CIAT 652]MDH6650904.1 4-amino-4-deoxy-L-arabinose transferase-like glycosyltransferase [Rhizobium esperanzae]ANL27206.1 PMT family glycosyltransferase protein [Rhizobium phaseoli]ANL39832.1 PMT family glycosyltransferase protein [Rhizobium phaseoli]ANL52535.1 PMT family glycosyltransferase protein [Rhizobium phaseoli]
MLERITKSLTSASIFLAVYFLLNIALRIALPHTLDLDEAEQAFYSQYLLAGYGPQPPFYNWIQYAIVSVTGITMWALSVPKNIILFGCYLFYGLAAREVLKSRLLPPIAMLSLITLPQVGLMAQRELTHTVALLFATSLFLFGFFRTLRQPTIGSYLVIGIATGIGLISKYNFAILPFAAFIAVLPERKWRGRLFDWRLLPAIVIAILIVLPHALWLPDNLANASAPTLERMTAEHEAAAGLPRIGQGLLSLVIAVLGFVALPIIVVAAAFRRDFIRALSSSSPMIRVIERMIVVSLLAFAGIVVFAGASDIHERWLDPCLLVLLIYLFLKLETAGLDLSAGLARFRPVVPVFMIVILSILLLRIVAIQYIGTYTRTNVPFANYVTELTATRKPVLIVAGTKFVAGNMKLEFPDVPVVIPFFPGPGVPEYAAAKGPVLVVWRGETANDPTISPSFANDLVRSGIHLKEINTLTLPYLFGDGKHTFSIGYSWVEGGAQ